MLSSVLKSEKAIEVNIAIMRAFVLMRQYALSHIELSQKLEALEKAYNQKFADVFDAIEYLLKKEQQAITQSQRVKIGYKKN